MAGMVLDCIPKNGVGNEISKKLLLQYNKVEEKGVSLYTARFIAICKFKSYGALGMTLMRNTWNET